MAEEEESGNPSSSYGESFLLPGPSQGNDGSQFGVPPSLAYLQGYEPDDSASLGMFAGGEPSQPGYAVDSVFPTSQPLDDTLSYHPDGVRGSRPILPRKDSTRSSGCSRTSNKSGQNNSTDAMISRVMSRFQSYDDLSKKKHKTWEEKEVRKILGTCVDGDELLS
ncbi:hypothetical protein L202_05701 [Cryptococcus amylolentus CBS 6039]|uniref:Uncharacterized protein n=1 Tax=Cryptococcus amylolentus CBS 6039 TaxID=1295533 RepID=A0A1E3HLE4_9TREE|nr:hypothetical protein L202_05701 [Cryptococcus amylolentus CBS 6039]ODN77177.1 hypothetical protein L202_05701 [Cryptococcus amylolentus CBS 6039]